MKIQLSRVPHFLAKQHGWPAWAVSRVRYNRKDGTWAVIHFAHEDHVKEHIDILEREGEECPGLIEVEELIL